MAKRLTAVAVENAKPGAGRREVSDGGSGLWLVVQPSGKRSWAVRYRHQGSPRKLTLGTYPALSLAFAREQAAQALRKVDQKEDPAATKREGKQADQAAAAAQGSLQDAFVEFLDKHRKGKIRDSTKGETARLLGLRRKKENDKEWEESGNGVLARWQKIKTLQAVTKRDVVNLLDALMAADKKVTANRTLAALKTMFRFHVKRDNLQVSPAAMIDDPWDGEKKRDRVLTDTELAALWHAADEEGYPFGRMVQLLILTGCRRDEVRGAVWREFDLKKREWLIPGERTKNGRKHLVPLSDSAMEILENPKKLPRIRGEAKLLFTTTGKTPISGLSKIKARVAKAMAEDLGVEPEPWTLHDIRRTVSTGLQKLKIDRDVREAVVNHTIPGVRGVYEHHDYEAEKRAALDKWARHVDSIVTGKSAKVIQLRAKRR